MALQAGHLVGKYREERACHQEEEIGRAMLGTLARLSLGLAIATALCLSPSLCEGRAQAASLSAKDTARAKRAKQLYKDGQYEEAAKIFSSLCSNYPDTLVLTRNLGACYYYLRRPEPALSNLREYLRRAPDISAEDRSEVEGWVAEMEKLRGQPTPSPAPAPPPPPVLPVTAAAGPAPASSAPAPSSPTPATPSPAGAGASSQPSDAAMLAETVTTTPQAQARSHSTLAWIAGGIGVVGLAGGGVCTALTLSKFSTTESQYNPSAESAGKTYAALQWVGYGVGAAGIATAILLFTLNPSASSPVALTPMLGQGFAGASVAGIY